MVARFGEVWAERGFDNEDLQKPWLMVPLKKYNFVLLHDGKGLNLKFDHGRLGVREIKGKNKSTVIENIAAAEAKRDDPTEADWIESSYDAVEAFYRLGQATNSRLFAVRGKRGGLTSIDALDGRVVKASLSVSVHPEKVVSVAFNFVKHRDDSGKFKELTRCNPSHASQWIANLNDIFAPQSNVRFKKYKADWVFVDKNLGSKVSLDQWDDIGNKRDKNADLNIFLVGNWVGTGDDPNGSFIRATKDVVCDDRPGYAALIKTMSHEVGHFLGAGHPPMGKRHWMMEMSHARIGNKITKQHVFNFNPW